MSPTDPILDTVADPADAFELHARRAGAALRQPAPADGLHAVRRSRHRRKVATTAMSAVALTGVIGVATFALLNRDSTDTIVPASDPAVPSSPDTSPPPKPSDPPTSIASPVEITADTPVYWAAGYPLVALIDGELVSFTDDLTPPFAAGDVIDLGIRTGDVDQYTLVADCNGFAFIDNPLVAGSTNGSAGTLDGGGLATDEFAAVVTSLGLDPAQVVGSQVGDVVALYAYLDGATTPNSTFWFGLWDPATGEVTTVAGDPDPTKVDEPFAVGGDGPIDFDGNGSWEIIVATSTDVRLIDTTTATVVAERAICD